MNIVYPINFTKNICSKCGTEGTLIYVDKNGNDISGNFTVEYGQNTNVGVGTITITGKLENSYCGTKVLKFTILPKWLKWIF